MKKNQKTHLVTGAVGFIGFHLTRRLLAEGNRVVAVDNFNDYYDVSLKEARHRELKKLGGKNYVLERKSIEKVGLFEKIFQKYPIHTAFHIAAQAGVRYSVEKPEVYLRSNVDGTFRLIEAARKISEKKRPKHLLLASSSSVYGMTDQYPFREDDAADRPVSLYGATKRTNELMAHSYSSLFGLRITMLRFFTVYGPWGRPDMAPYKFVERVLKGKEIEVFNGGDMVRDFTYVDDIVDGTLGLADARLDLADTLPLYDVFNIGCAQPRQLMDFIRAIETATGKKAKIKMLPFQPGDVQRTFADISKLKALTGYTPKMGMEEGVKRFAEWYREYTK